MQAELTFIGEITTPYTDLAQCPNFTVADGEECTVTVYAEFAQALLGLQEGDAILLLYWFDQSQRNLLVQKKLHSEEVVGTFTLRSPHRPNPIALAHVKIKRMSANTLIVQGLDCLSGTKLLDIKPAVKNEG